MSALTLIGFCFFFSILPAVAASSLDKAVQLVTEGKYAEAKQVLQQLVDSDPNQTAPYIYLGIVENQLNQPASAVPLFEKALGLQPDSIAAHYNLALSLLRLERFEDAAVHFKAVVDVNPQLFQANYNLGRLLLQAGRYEEAIPYLEVAYSQQPGDDAVIVNLVAAYLKEEPHLEKALQLSDKVLPTASLEVSVALGRLYLEEGQFESAVRSFLRARTLAPDNVQVAIYLGRAYLFSEQPKNAQETLQPLTSAAGHWEIEYLLGLACKKLGQFQKAVTHLQSAVQLKEDEPDPHYHLGLILWADSEPSAENGSEQIRKQVENIKATRRLSVRKARALQELDRAVELRPSVLDYVMALGHALLEAYQIPQAVQLFEYTQDLVKPSAEFWLLYGLAKAELEGGQSARPIVERAVQMDPTMAPGFNLLGNCYLRTGDYAGAARHYKKAAQLDPTKALYFYDAALALERSGQLQEALRHARESARLKPDDASYRYLYGKLLSKLGQHEEALAELEKSVRLDPTLEYPYYNLARTYQRLGRIEEAARWTGKLQEVRKANKQASDKRTVASEELSPVSVDAR